MKNQFNEAVIKIVQLPVFDMFTPVTETGKLWMKRNIMILPANGGRTEGLPGCDKQRLPTDAHPVVHHPYGAQQPEIRVVEGLQSRHRRVKRCVRLRRRRLRSWRWMCSRASGTINIRKSAKAGVHTGKISIRSSAIRKAIYTTNAIESLNTVIRAAIKKRKEFPTDDSVRKLINLAIKDASKKWSMPIQNWRLAMSRFTIEFGDRLSDHL